MKKIIPYLLIIIFLLAGAGVYLQLSGGEENILGVELKSKKVASNTNTPPDKKTIFNNLGAAPEFVGITKWLGSEPLAIADLRGKVVLVDFWTYSCINCIRTLPYVTKWHEKYKDQGLVIVGVHTPEFAFEKVTSNVETAIKRYNIAYPVAQDNNYKTWSAYSNQFWPAHYLIDKNGDIMYTHFGEGEYQQTELAIRTLLGLEGEFETPPAPSANQAKTPELYLGTLRLGTSFGGTETAAATEQIFAFPKKLVKNKFALEGKWRFDQESVVHTQGFGRLRLQYNAAKVFMVAQAQEPTTVKVYIDGKLIKGVVVGSSDLYSLFEDTIGGEHTLEIEIPTGGIQIFTFTFG